MLRLILVRHGETEWNAVERCQGWTDVPLSESGRVQADAAADALRQEPLAAVYSSDLQRAFETAERIAKPHGLPVQPREAFRELHHGELEGLTRQELFRDYGELLQRWMAAPADVEMPGHGESLRQVQERVWPALKEILAAHTDGTVVVVSHTLALRTLLARIIGLPLDNFRRFHLDTCGLTYVEVDGRFPGMVVRTLNAIEHLPAPAERKA